MLGTTKDGVFDLGALIDNIIIKIKGWGETAMTVLKVMIGLKVAALAIALAGPSGAAGAVALSGGLMALAPAIPVILSLTAAMVGFGFAIKMIGRGVSAMRGINTAVDVSTVNPVKNKLNAGAQNNLQSNRINVDMSETNGLLRELIKSNEILMGKLTNKVADLGVA